jgi:aurora kinase, other
VCSASCEFANACCEPHTVCFDAEASITCMCLCRDLKPENILIGSDGTLRLSDFGWSVHTLGGKRRKTMCGTVDYLAPEIVKETEYDFAIDNWCVGVLCYEFLYGHPPFESSLRDETNYKIMHQQPKFPSSPQVCNLQVIPLVL